jgi:hypothetical protein
LAFLSVGISGSLRFDELLDGLERADLLFTRRRMRGVLPLSANTLTINISEPDERRLSSRVAKGRFYFSILDTEDRRQAWLESLRGYLQGSGMTIYS